MSTRESTDHQQDDAESISNLSHTTGSTLQLVALEPTKAESSSSKKRGVISEKRGMYLVHALPCMNNLMLITASVYWMCGTCARTCIVSIGAPPVECSGVVKCTLLAHEWGNKMYCCCHDNNLHATKYTFGMVMIHCSIWYPCHEFWDDCNMLGGQYQ